MSISKLAASLKLDGEIGRTDAVTLSRAAFTKEARAELVTIAENDQLVRPEARSVLLAEGLSPKPAGVQDHRLDAFFDKYPITGTYVTKSGATVPRQYHAYDGELLAFHGLMSNVAAVEDLMAGSGLVPMTTTAPDGARSAIGHVYLNKIADSTLGPYNELMILIDAVPAQTPEDKRQMPYTNGFSTLLPAMGGAQSFVVKLLLDSPNAIDWGRELLGTDKSPGRFKMKDRGGRASVADECGQPVMRTSFRPDRSQQAMEAMMQGFGAALQAVGIPPGPPPSELRFSLKSRLSKNDPIHTWSWITDVIPANQEVSADTVTFDEGSEWGGKMKELGFSAKLASFAPTIRGAIVEEK